MSTERTCCPGATATLKNISNALHFGHLGIAKTYREIAASLGSEPEEQRLYFEAATRHEMMAQESLKIVVPNEEADAIDSLQIKS